jgi:hypothetical protein
MAYRIVLFGLLGGLDVGAATGSFFAPAGLPAGAGLGAVLGLACGLVMAAAVRATTLLGRPGSARTAFLTPPIALLVVLCAGALIADLRGDPNATLPGWTPSSGLILALPLTVLIAVTGSRWCLGAPGRVPGRRALEAGLIPVAITLVSAVGWTIVTTNT